MQSRYLELKIMAMPAFSFCVSALIIEDNEALTVHGLMNKPSQSHRKEALDERKWRERAVDGWGLAKYTHLLTFRKGCFAC